MSTDAAVRAAAAALHALRLEGNYVRHEGDCPCCGVFARAAVEAARPIIAQQAARLALAAAANGTTCDLAEFGDCICTDAGGDR